MAVEARHLNLFLPQSVQTRENLMNHPQQDNGVHTFNQQQMRFPAIPFPENYQSLYTQPKTSINTESGLTCNIPISRKRSRDSADELFTGTMEEKNRGASFFGGDILPQIHQYQLEIDAVVTEHTKKIRLELQQKQNQHTKQLLSTIGESMMKTLKEKDNHIQKITGLNLMLQEKVKSLYIENQLWRDLAQTNEATANYLRGEFELALAHAGGAAAPEEEEVESCGSSNHGETTSSKEVCYGDRRCSRCRQRRCSVLLLPCRHLCLCSLCGSGCHQLQTCPVCDSAMTATLHVNMLE